MVAYTANRRTILALSLVLVLVIVFLHITQFRAYFDGARQSEWFRSFQQYSEAQDDFWVGSGATIKEDGQQSVYEDGPLSLDVVHSIVKQTNGYLARDWSMWLVWNNVCVVSDLCAPIS